MGFAVGYASDAGYAMDHRALQHARERHCGGPITCIDSGGKAGVESTSSTAPTLEPNG